MARTKKKLTNTTKTDVEIIQMSTTFLICVYTII